MLNIQRFMGIPSVLAKANSVWPDMFFGNAKIAADVWAK